MTTGGSGAAARYAQQLEDEANAGTGDAPVGSGGQSNNHVFYLAWSMEH